MDRNLVHRYLWDAVNINEYNQAVRVITIVRMNIRASAQSCFWARMKTTFRVPISSSGAFALLSGNNKNKLHTNHGVCTWIQLHIYHTLLLPCHAYTLSLPLLLPLCHSHSIHQNDLIYMYYPARLIFIAIIFNTLPTFVPKITTHHTSIEKEQFVCYLMIYLYFVYTHTATMVFISDMDPTVSLLS